MQRIPTAAAFLALCATACGPAAAGAAVGDKAPLFKSVDENMKPVDMREMIRGRPLVLAVGSAS
jgi:hypothetical protein